MTKILSFGSLHYFIVENRETWHFRSDAGDSP